MAVHLKRQAQSYCRAHAKQRKLTEFKLQQRRVLFKKQQPRINITFLLCLAYPFKKLCLAVKLTS